jgi:hypothetical protein
MELEKKIDAKVIEAMKKSNSIVGFYTYNFTTGVWTLADEETYSRLLAQKVDKQ